MASQTGDAPQRRRSTTLTVGTVGAVALALALCGCSSGPDYQGICADKRTGTRVDDSFCEHGNKSGGSGGYGWWYARSGSRVPAVGQTLPKAGGGEGFVSPKSGSVVRGGFSAHGGTVGG
ncbi:hypothetical protein [Streptomyces sp. SID2888]|uniref:hypothetical protein n=1 Tax=Streptomyces sp. SID2888 TaxID=2690256 RepID=UPI00136EBF01|nr:hypothetical protein [Streptomyces sp. SID2888]MYV44189.1 hypothetical protein [Streptomyces sp. SID2888]